MAKRPSAPKSGPESINTKGRIMHDAKKAQEMFTQGSGKVVETMTVWADANQRVLRELAELSAATAKEGVRLYAELQQSGIEAARERRLLRLGLALLQPVLQRAEAVAQGRDFLAQLVGILGHRGAVALGLGGRRGRRRDAHRPPPGPHRPVAEDPLHVALAGDHAFQARAHRLLHEVLPALAVLDELMEERGGQARAARALVLEDDLRERDRGEVLAGPRVHHGDLATAADHLLDLLEGDVPALLRVVELTVGVPLDDVRHRAAILTPRVNGHKNRRRVRLTLLEHRQEEVAP